GGREGDERRAGADEGARVAELVHDGPGSSGERPDHRSIQALASKRWRILRAYTPNSSDAMMSRSRGRGRSTPTISWMRPGRADMTTTRSARNTASGIECVMKTIVFWD